MELKKPNPAEEAAVACLDSVMNALGAGKNFLVEAGAGAGKTYTLIKSLQFLIDKYGETFLRNRKRVACITYTNVAKEEIRSRTDNHPVVLAETIHAFCWELIKVFQKSLRIYLPSLSEKWAQRCEDTKVSAQNVIYNLGYPKLTDTEAFLHHDDVIKLMTFLLDDPKFQGLLKNRFPVILIDEYQDTSRILAESLIFNFIENGGGPQIGFFGDHWQKIYGSGSIGKVQASTGKLEVIGKNANFRSDRLIVEALNRIRVELPQNPSDPDSAGEIAIFHSNTFDGQRRTESHWKDDLPENESHDFILRAKTELVDKGWLFNEQTKILMLTNAVLAAEQGYRNLLGVFSDSDDLLKKNNHYIAFLSEVIDPAITAFDDGKYGQMFRALGLKTPKIRKHGEKAIWYDHFNELSQKAKEATIGDLIDTIWAKKLLRLPEKILDQERALQEFGNKTPEELTPEEAALKDKLDRLRSVSFAELTAFGKYIEDKTPFSTNHGVKGAQFENVLIIFGRGWNQYNWNQMLEWASDVPAKSSDSFERNRNLFYVACSRPKKRLALAFTQKLSDKAIEQLESWFAVKSTAI